jgi:hypothetical protein
MALSETLFTKSLTVADSPFTVVEEDGIEAASIKVTSAIPCTLLGTKTIRSISSDAVTIDEDQVVNIGTRNGVCCFTLTIPAGATAEIIAF